MPEVEVRDHAARQEPSNETVPEGGLGAAANPCDSCLNLHLCRADADAPACSLQRRSRPQPSGARASLERHCHTRIDELHVTAELVPASADSRRRSELRTDVRLRHPKPNTVDSMLNDNPGGGGGCRSERNSEECEDKGEADAAQCSARAGRIVGLRSPGSAVLHRSNVPRLEQVLKPRHSLTDCPYAGRRSRGENLRRSSGDASYFLPRFDRAGP